MLITNTLVYSDGFRFLGDCIPTEGLGQAPISIYYPFGCRCAPNRCDARGPIVSSTDKKKI